MRPIRDQIEGRVRQLLTELDIPTRCPGTRGQLPPRVRRLVMFSFTSP
jgi:hypothetical protein